MHRTAARLVATTALLLALAACAAPTAPEGPPDLVGADRAVPIPAAGPEAGADADADAAAPDTLARATGAIPCATDVPAGASAAAVAYAAAVNASSPASHALDAKIHAAGDTIFLDDLATQVENDAAFLAEVEAIHFPPDVAPVAQDFVASVHAYDDFLRATLEAGDFPDGYHDTDMRLLNARAQNSSNLRDLLNLPSSGCTLRRP